MKAYFKDIFKTIRHEKSRFISLMIISALGVLMMTGLKAGCEDTLISADSYFDMQGLHDLYIQSTLGLTDSDIDELSALSGVKSVEGFYEETDYIKVASQKYSVLVTTISKSIDVPYLYDGRLPESDNEIAVTKDFADCFEIKTGDAISLELTEDTVIKNDKFVISGIILNVTDINNTEGATAFRATAATDYVFYVAEEAVNSNIYTGIGVCLDEGAYIDTFSDEYKKLIADFSKKLVSIKKTCENNRTEAVKTDANLQIDEKEAEMYKEFSAAEEKLATAKKELEDAEKELSDNQKKLDEGKKELEAAKNEIEANKETLEAEKEELEKLKAALEQYIESGHATEEILSQYAMVEAGLEKIEGGQKTLLESEKTVLEKEAELKEGQEQLDEGMEACQKGWSEYEVNEQNYQKEKETALSELAKARQEVEDIAPAVWYIFTRDNLSGYNNIYSDMTAIKSLSTLFAVVFLLVAVLISLTTMNRLIEEERGIIGTYQALGFRDGEILLKYLFYAFFASLMGGIMGDLLGYLLLPKILFIVFDAMYIIPEFSFSVDIIMVVLAPAIFIISILATVCASCYKTLRKMPARLMRPKTPKAGSRVLLERIPFIWKRFSFLNKVTARNIFRYKKRLLMTLIGIMGCTSLLVCGFGVKDSVDNLLLHQYSEIVHYDMLGVSGSDNYEEFSALLDEKDADYLSFMLNAVTLKNKSGDTLQTQVYVFEDLYDLEDYLTITRADTEEKIDFVDDRVYITCNAGTILGFDTGDTVSIQDSNFRQADIMTGEMVDNYLGNMIYMSRSTYEKYYGEYEANAFLVRADIIDEISESDLLRSSVVTETLKKEFKTSVYVIDMVVVLLIVLSGALAFVVLYTLSSTNISERERELATVKVLGFFDREVHLYVNKEVIILSILGTVLGLPVGSVLCHMLTAALKMPALTFVVSIKNITYVYAFLITILFSLIVNTIMHRLLDRIDPVTALKSIE